MADRGHWSSKLGFVLAAAGAPVGLGNIWKFPYITGENGGGACVLIYLACIAGIGLPVMMAEILLGRATQKSPVGAIKALGGGFWVVFGGLGILGGVVILSYYSVVDGMGRCTTPSSRCQARLRAWVRRVSSACLAQSSLQMRSQPVVARSFSDRYDRGRLGWR